jgi:cysteine-rich repeat protein
MIAPAYASTAGPNSPGTVVSDASFGTAAWSDPANAQASDDAYATTSPGGFPTQYLKGTNFGFSLPAGAVIIGISATVERTSAAGTVFDASVRIVKGGTVTGSEHANPPSSFWPDMDAVAPYGSTSDLWGTAWTGTDINASGFGLAISAEDSFDTAAVDQVTLTVTYSLCGDSVIEGAETCDDGNTNNGDCCSSTCQLDANGAACTSDGDVCTDDECDGAGACQHPNNTAPCDDGDPCTSSDVCSAGVCAGTGFCLDRFKCYQGKDLKTPKFVKLTGVNTTDQLISNQLVDAKKLKYVCAAVDVNGAGIENPNAYLSCYLIVAPQLSPRPALQLSTQFQMSKFEAKKGKLLCLPSSLTTIP